MTNTTASDRRRVAYAILCVFVLACCGCDTLRNHECCLFKSGGIFSSDRDDRPADVERLSSSKEKDVIARASSASVQRREAWEPTEAELRYARNHNVDLRDYVWSAQRPNGGVLFPRELKASGPIVVMEPSEICAPVGTDVIVVASYVGEDSQYMRTGERLDWNLSGVGQFVSTNPNAASSFLSCPWSSNKRAVEGRSLTTETSARLYNITRGTKATEDDVAILRGQSWTAVTSYEEGTSTISVVADSIPDWNKRRAGATIHWVDAAFLYPKSGVGPLKRPTSNGTRNGWTDLETIVIRRSNADALANWRVRYEVLNGEGVFEMGNGSFSRYCDVSTDASGAAKARLTLQGENPRAGTSQIKASIIRPGTSDIRESIVNSRTFSYTWTTTDVLGAELLGPKVVAVGQEVTYELYVNNYSEFYYSSNISVTLPANAEFVRCDARLAPKDTNDPTRKTYEGLLINLKPLSYTAVRLVVRKVAEGPMNIDVQLSNKSPSERPTNERAQTNNDYNASGASANNNNSYNASGSSGNNYDNYNASGSSGNNYNNYNSNGSNGMTPPATSDPSVQPSL